MNIWALILIVCAVAMVIGPIAMMQPSQRDRRLMGLRQAAAQKGIGVRLATLELSSGAKSVAIYSLPLPKSDKPRAEWSLIKQPFEHEFNFHGHWDWGDKKNRASDADNETIRNQLMALDDSIVGIELANAGIGVYWSEKELGIDDIETILVRLKNDLHCE